MQTKEEIRIIAAEPEIDEVGFASASENRNPSVGGADMQDPSVTYRGVVYPWQCDHMGHMNVMWYVGKFDEATWQFFAMLGLSPSALRGEHRGMAAVQQNITYRRELRAGDVVSVRTELLEVREKTIRFRHEMQNDETGEITATAELTGVHMDTVRRKACPLPEAVLDRARSWIIPRQEGSHGS